MNNETQIEGRRALREALQAGRAPDRLYVLKSGEGLGSLVSAAREMGAAIIECDRAQLDRLSVTKAHQGVIATLPILPYARPEDIFARAAEKDEAPLIVVCDGVEDERNLGAIIRCAEAAGAHGVVISKRRSAGLSALTAKTSAGAVEHLPVARVPGIPAYLKTLKERGVWIYGAAAGGSSGLFDTDFSGPMAIVLGSEGRGLSRLTSEQCDFLLSIPMYGKVGSLNVSAAAAVILYQAAGSRESAAGGKKRM